MSEQRDRNEERIDDLEVRGDEAREIAGGKKAQKKGIAASKRQGKASGMAAAKSRDSRSA